jgi:acyl-CoA reductase-like NAD-dependent aldehyde dehydrogenase
VKNTKAQDILAKQKADAAKATLPPLAEKSTMLLKVSETLARRKAEAAKVAAAEREKKKTHDPTVAGDVDKTSFEEEALGNHGESETDYAQGERAR